MTAASGFHIPSGIYALSHSVGCLPLAARVMFEAEFFEPWTMSGGDAWREAWLPAIKRFQAALASLLGGGAEDYCPQVNNSSALTRLLGALPVPAGRNTLLIHADAFPSIRFVLSAMSRRGFHVETIPKDMNPADADVWARFLTPQTALALLTHVHSATGRVTPLSEVAALCRKAGVFTVADIAQSAGILPLDLPLLGVDAAIGSSVKWLCGGPGAGFLWVAPGRVTALEPDDVGWFSHENPFEMDGGNFRYAPGAARFMGGTPQVAPFIIARAGIEAIAAIGAKAVLAHNRALIAAFAGRCPGLALPDLSRTGGTLCLPLGTKAEKAAGALMAAGARFDRREDTLRLSFHIYNRTEEAAETGRILSESLA